MNESYSNNVALIESKLNKILGELDDSSFYYVKDSDSMYSLVLESKRKEWVSRLRMIHCELIELLKDLKKED